MKHPSTHYRYYISQNLLQYRDHPKGIVARLPADEIESAVAATLESKIKSIKEVAQLLDMNLDEHHELLSYIMEHARTLDSTDLVRKAVKKVIVDANQISLEIDAAELHKEIANKLGLSLPSYTGDRITKITAPYGTYRSKKGAIIINAKTQDK